MSMSGGGSPNTLLIMGAVGFGLFYLWRNLPTVGQLASGAAAAGEAAAAGGLQFVAGGVYGAAAPIANALFPKDLNPVGGANPQGFPAAGTPYYNDYLAAAAGRPNMVPNIAPGATTQTGRVFEQFTPLYSPSYAWPTPNAQVGQ